MYKNYGDVNFFEYGILIDDDHSDTVFPMILCRPYDDVEDLFIFNDQVIVDIEDNWIDKKKVMDYSGLDNKNYNNLDFAIGCIDYYSWDNFGIPYNYDWQHMNKKSICEILKHKFIAKDNLHIEW